MSVPMSFVTLAVNDVQQAAQFYQRLWGIAPRWIKEGMAVMELQNIRLALATPALLQQETGLSMRVGRASTSLISFNLSSREKVDLCMANACDAGATSSRSPVETAWGGYAGFFQAPDGQFWEAVWNPKYKMT
ncbi:MAG: VOC family protein [Verrucomicrobiales bacterium]